MPFAPKIDEIDLAFVDPVFEGGALFSDKGGIVKAPNVHFEAHALRFERKGREGKKGHLIARGGIYAKYFGSCFVGEELEYDFASKTGILRLGRVQVGSWNVGGSEIHLLADGSYDLRHAWAATRTFPGIVWHAGAKQMRVQRNREVDFTSLTLKAGNCPLASFGWLNTRAETIEHFPLSLSIQLGSKNARKFGVRYTKNWNHHRWLFQLDRWWTRDWGAGLRAESLDKGRDWSTAHYFMRDQEHRKKVHFICNGRFSHKWPARDARISGQISRTSDFHFADRLAHSRHFKPHKSTFIAYRKEWPSCVLNARAVVKVNPYETRKQQLPALQLLPKSQHWGNFFCQQSLESAHLVLSYPRNNRDNQFSAWRTIWNGRLYRHQRLGRYLTATGGIGARGYAISRKPASGSCQWITPCWEGHLQMPLWAEAIGFSTHCQLYIHHTLAPELPSRALNCYVFDLEESTTAINSLNWGARGVLNCKDRPFLDYNFSMCDPIGSWGKPRPRRYLIDLTWRLTPRLECDVRSWVNRDQKAIDRTLFRLRATVSETMAALLEYDRRGSKSWRGIGDDRDWLYKWHSDEELLRSNLSDRRQTLSSTLYWVVDPDLALKWQARRGFGRSMKKGGAREKSYSEWGLGAVAILPGQWKMQLAYEQRTGRRGLRRYSINLVTNSQALIVTKPKF